MNVLDTDSLSLLMQGHERLRRRVADAEDVCITIITRIEILQGRFASLLKAADGAQLQQAQHWLAENERFMSALIVLLINGRAAAEFDRLSANRRFRKIGRADLLIASITLAHRGTLVTRNRRHFQQIPSLAVEDWSD